MRVLLSRGNKPLLLIGLLLLALALASCGTTTSQPTQQAGTGDSLIKTILPTIQSGDVQNPLDSTPDFTGTTIYFTASNASGSASFRCPLLRALQRLSLWARPLPRPEALPLARMGSTSL
jgi:hypothetical protein